MVKKVVLAVLMLVIAGSSIILADTPVIRKRERRQMQRINQGVQQGQLTNEQAKDLKQEVRDVRKEKREMLKQNGGQPLSREQRVQLLKEQNANSKRIYQQKHSAPAPQPVPGAHQ